MLDDIEQLVHLTLNSENLNARDLYQQDIIQNHFTYDFEAQIMPPKGPGVFFKLQKSLGTFVIRSIAVNDLEKYYASIIKYPENFPSLRLAQGELPIEKELKFFQTDTLAIAQILQSTVSNKRFPLEEENIFNISDPGFSWWLKKEDDHIEVFFKLAYTHDMDSLIKIGPLGEADSGKKVFEKLYRYFCALFPVSEFSSTQNSFIIGTSQKNSKLFNCFINMFETGEVDTYFWQQLKQLEESSQGKSLDLVRIANEYMLELSNVRKFWVQIDKLLQ